MVFGRPIDIRTRNNIKFQLLEYYNRKYVTVYGLVNENDKTLVKDSNTNQLEIYDDKFSANLNCPDSLSVRCMMIKINEKT